MTDFEGNDIIFILFVFCYYAERILKMNKKIIITVLSPIKEPKRVFSYSSDCCDIIKTDWTNEAGLRYLLKTVSDCTDVICMCSEEVDNNKHKNRVREIVRSCGYENIEPCFIKYQTNTPLVDITNSLINEFTFESSDTVFLDTTGGFRSVVYSLVYLFRYFEYVDINIEKAIYSSLNFNNNTGKIGDIKNTFRMFDLINGVHEFTTSGNPQTLQRFFHNNTNLKIKLLLNGMTEFYDAISLCRLNNISSSIKKLNKTMNDLLHDEPKNFDETLFINLIPAIKKKFSSSGKFTDYNLIKWCLSNNLLQQAITIYVEKLPRAYFKELKFLKSTVPEDELVKKSPNPGTDVYVEYFLASNINNSNDNNNSEMDRIVKEKYQYLKLSARRNYEKDFKNSNYSKECIENFKTIVDIRDMFYDSKGERVKYTQSDKQERKLLDKMGLKEVSQLPLNIEKLLTLLKNNRYFFRSKAAFAEELDASKNSKSINNNYRRAVNGDMCAEVLLSIDKDTIQKLRLDYLYVKYIRNQINHASSITDDEPAFKELMSSGYGYEFPEDNNFSASQIKSFLQTSIQYIDNITKEK